MPPQARILNTETVRRIFIGDRRRYRLVASEGLFPYILGICSDLFLLLLDFTEASLQLLYRSKVDLTFERTKKPARL